MPKRKASAPAGKAPPKKKEKKEVVEEDEEYTEAELKRLKVVDLRGICTEFGLSSSGLKADLINRILDHQDGLDDEEDEDEEMKPTPSSSSSAPISSAPPSSLGPDPLDLKPLFDGGAEVWYPVLKGIIEAQPNAKDFIGPSRGPNFVPVREMTFQALKAAPPHAWKCIIFGQTPYPRVESDTGVAFFDNAIENWDHPQFSKTATMRCLIKAACNWEFGEEKRSLDDVRKLLRNEQVVEPADWASAMLAQGALFINVGLTCHSNDKLLKTKHAAFWKPVMKEIVNHILKCKEDHLKSGGTLKKDDPNRGLLFGWWGACAKDIRKSVEKMENLYPNVKVVHVEHCNPAARYDVFTKGNPLKVVNDNLEGMNLHPINWLPRIGWDGGDAAGSDSESESESESESDDKGKEKEEEESDTHNAPLPDLGADPLKLRDLFEGGGGAPWYPILKPVIEAQPDAADFIGPGRDAQIVPVRELTLQALKPTPPHGWKVVVFGQTPYPRVESATGIAMFDNTFETWESPRFSKVVSMRTIMKCACHCEYGEVPDSVSEVKKILKKNKIVQPPEWFMAMLAQGVLLLNAGLTCHSGGQGKQDVASSRHVRFWRPVVEEIIRGILQAKADKIKEAEGKKKKDDDDSGGIVFAWWGTGAKPLEKIVAKLEDEFPTVRIVHVDHCNPAANGEMFCKSGNHFKDLNDALTGLDMKPIHWLPEVGWDAVQTKPSKGEKREERMSKASLKASAHMKNFIQNTQDLHKSFLERLGGAKNEIMDELPEITGVLDLPVPTFSEAMKDIHTFIGGLVSFEASAIAFAERVLATYTPPPSSSSSSSSSSVCPLDLNEVAAVFMYTQECNFYRKVNESLRDPKRKNVAKLKLYLRLFFSALDKIPPFGELLYRGVAKDLRKFYRQGMTVTWWGVSSCTSKRSVAEGFMGSSGTRLLFEISAKRGGGIKAFSAFQGEEEYLLAPGTQLKVRKVVNETGGLVRVLLDEVQGDRLVN